MCLNYKIGIFFEECFIDVGRRTITRTYTPKAVTDINTDGVIDVNDDALVDAGDDFGFNEGIQIL